MLGPYLRSGPSGPSLPHWASVGRPGPRSSMFSVQTPGMGGKCETPRRVPGRFDRSASDSSEEVDLVEVLGAQLLVLDAEALLRRERQDADLALVLVVVHVERGLADLLEGVDLRQGRVDLALGDEAVGLPRLAVVGEVAGDDLLEVHPQVAVVV